MLYRLAANKVKPEYRKLVTLFDKLTGSRSLWQVFNDCIEMFALCLQNVYCFGNEYKKNETRYKDIAKEYSKSEFDIITQIFAEITNMFEENPFRDLLGDLYMQLNMGSDALGQFFTPYAVAVIMAEATFIKNDEKTLFEKGYITVHEPSVGGGANVIAFCEILKNHDYNYQNQCIFICQELSRLTAMMCYVALSLIGCAAVIKVGDSLANPYTNYVNERSKGSELWTTPLFHVNNCYKKV